MKSLLLSTRNFETKIKKLATRPVGVNPEPITRREYVTRTSIVVLITVENCDNIQDTVRKLVLEINSFSKDTGIRTVVIYPFGHLSRNLASSEKTLQFFDLLEHHLTEYNTIRIHFGSHKSLMLDIFGHKGNVRFRDL